MKKGMRRIITLLLAITVLMSSFIFAVPASAKDEGLSLKRQTVIQEMKRMSIAKWVPSQTYKTYHYYAYGSGGGTYHTWTQGRAYYGLPYSQNPNIVNPINHRICVTYDVFAGSLSKNGTLSRDLGRNDCSSSVVMALQTVDHNIQLTFTSRMRPGVNNLVAVGNYTYYGDKATTCSKNGSSVMYSCYKKLKPGDLLIRDGHASMVVANDTSSNVVTIVHQTGLQKHYNPETDTSRGAYSYNDMNSTWGVNDKFSYYYAWSNGYIPLASKTLVEDDKKPHEITMCDKVRNVKTAESTASSVTLSWDKSNGATGYIIYQFKNGEFVKIGTTKKTSYTIDNLNSASDYRFAVKSYLKADKTYVQIDFAILVATTTPKKVTGVTATLNKRQVAAVVTWNKTNRAESYYVYQATKKDGKYKYVGMTEGATSLRVENLEKDKTYYFKVKAGIYRGDTKLKGELSKAAKAI